MPTRTVEVSVEAWDEEGTPELLKSAIEYALDNTRRFSPDHRFKWTTARVDVVDHEVVRTP